MVLLGRATSVLNLPNVILEPVSLGGRGSGRRESTSAVAFVEAVLAEARHAPRPRTLARARALR